MINLHSVPKERTLSTLSDSLKMAIIALHGDLYIRASNRMRLVGNRLELRGNSSDRWVPFTNADINYWSQQTIESIDTFSYDWFEEIR